MGGLSPTTLPPMLGVSPSPPSPPLLSPFPSEAPTPRFTPPSNPPLRRPPSGGRVGGGLVTAPSVGPGEAKESWELTF